jgi:hypothetical protein
MPNPSPTEKVRILQEEVLVLKAQILAIQKDIDRSDVHRVRERLAVIDERLNRLDRAIEEHKQFPVLENRLAQLEEQKKLGDTRLFQFVMLFVGGVITLSVQIVLLFFKK